MHYRKEEAIPCIDTSASLSLSFNDHSTHTIDYACVPRGKHQELFKPSLSTKTSGNATLMTSSKHSASLSY
jgi:hypothetical protein